ncbi:15-hydroxyprostaglandin dehydrogenase [NAD(+)]-like [Haliotis rufescens]|uniref:15-hydroxyprostaglandin dehydrogenase [NAD(+)]-like n=1 Tax=Haliotis rufescens TaxID=6454 RepID=UPI001EAFC50F|nr:15-hydroxyprostaglandin dehydrogenase [NAD(+)]-like [Haliotis rufescens]
MKIEGSVAFITGAAMGVGKNVAEALLKEGAKVALADVAVEQGEATAGDFKKAYGDGRVFFVKCNVADEQSFKDAFASAVSHYGHIDLMLNNAGLVNEQRWKMMCSVNIDGVVIGTQLAVEHMRKDKGGRGGVIINTASMVGLVTRFVFPVYVASKHAVVGFTNSWAGNPYLGDMGLRFGTVCPTAVDTAFQKFKDEQLLYPEEFKQMLKAISLMGVDQAVEGFLTIIKDDGSNGRNLAITKDGSKYAHNQLVDG